MAPPPPLVSIALPLFESRPFLQVIEANLRGQDYPRLEILISHRHQRDDALASLRETFQGDSRVTFIEASDEVNWVAHYNSLLVAAHGTYFMWMPHDDSFPPNYVSTLVERLEARPDAVLAFGGIDPVDQDDEPLPQWFTPPPFGRGPDWTIRDSLRLLFWHPAVPFRGVFRRSVAIQHGLRIPDTLDTVGADADWVFVLSLVGPLTFVPAVVCRKRYHAGSASAAFRPGWRHLAEGMRRLHSDLRTHVHRRRDLVEGLIGVALWGAYRACTLPVRQLPRSAKLRLKAIIYGPPNRA